MITRLILTGMSGAGKSSVGSIAASTLAWRFVDMDDEIERRAGRTIPAIFAEHGETAFRAMESDLLRELLAVDRIVISTGGGAVCNDHAQASLAASNGTLSVWLHAEAETLLARVQQHQDATRTTVRPMLDGDEPLLRMRDLLAARTDYYAAADVTIPVGNRDAARTAADVVELVQLGNSTASEVVLDTGAVRSSIRVGQGTAATLPQVIADRWPKAQAIWIGADASVVDAHRDWLDRVTTDLPMPVHIHAIPSGETSKSLQSYGSVLDWLLEGGVQRGDVVVALGGGVVGDLMGFVAATVLRGVGLIQIPTTLLAMVDSSVGGKTGINHGTGKNLIGAFYQPPVVLVDPRFLGSLPEREFRSGFGEIIKHGVIQASTPGGEPGFLTEVLRLNTMNLLRRHEPLMSWVLRQNVSLKAAVVAEDEREADLRQILNFGHTIGHGIEAAGYRLLHGEAVGLGMIAIAELAAQRGDVTRDWASNLRALVVSYGLPQQIATDREQVLEKMRSDKKKSAGKQNWVLPRATGGVFVTSDVDDSYVRAAIDSVLETA